MRQEGDSKNKKVQYLMIEVSSVSKAFQEKYLNEYQNVVQENFKNY